MRNENDPELSITQRVVVMVEGTSVVVDTTPWGGGNNVRGGSGGTDRIKQNPCPVKQAVVGMWYEWDLSECFEIVGTGVPTPPYTHPPLTRTHMESSAHTL